MWYTENAESGMWDHGKRKRYDSDDRGKWRKKISLLLFRKDAYAAMTKDSEYTANKEPFIIPGASHTDLYDGGENKVIPFGRIAEFYTADLKWGVKDVKEYTDNSNKSA